MQHRDTQLLRVTLLAVGVALLASGAAEALRALIAVCTNLFYFQRLSAVPVSPWQHQLGAWAIAVPILGGLLVGGLARWGSPAIRGHGIPESMERVLRHESRIPKRLAVLKPLSAAIAIGSGGPFGAEGPIIATGSALGSMLGQLLPVSTRERKALLAAGAAAGMTATFGSPLSAVLLAIELLLFELSPLVLVPVVTAAAVAAVVRVALRGGAAEFAMPALAAPGLAVTIACAAIGAALGVAAVALTSAVYGIEEAFERLPLHFMWWPALGGIAVGVLGWFEPRILGVGYTNITATLDGSLAGRALAMLCLLKGLAWLLALGSGTSGGTLAPLFTLGGGLGVLLGSLLGAAFPSLGLDPHLAALVGMAALFAGASHAMLAAAVFACEVTGQTAALAPLLVACAAAYLVAGLISHSSIMTRKIERRGIHVPREFGPMMDPVA
ncbi:MAG: chloride channel protein [Deltaproteobacteria bacterium]|nr:chloride channel protein [Deltaproteobacteria bacterium]